VVEISAEKSTRLVPLGHCGSNNSDPIQGNSISVTTTHS